jgi:trehalose/maltose hydrolase-like predicted phosphorylase
VAPAWNEVDIFNGSSWLKQASTRSLASYRQALDMYHGTLRTSYSWTAEGKAVGIEIESFISRADPELCAVRFIVLPGYDGPMTVVLSLRGWPSPHRYPLERLERLEGEASRNQQAIWYPGHMIVGKRHAEAQTGRGLLQMLSKAEGTSTTLAQAISLEWPQDLTSDRIAPLTHDDSAAVEVRFHAKKGQSLTFCKYAVLLPSWDDKDLLIQAAEKARKMAMLGYKALYERHAAAWKKLWESDILVPDDPRMQTVIHSMLFYLLSSARENSAFSIPPMGLSSAGYYGHVFWDADTYMFPALLLLHPEIARSMMMFRYRTLDAARQNARKNGYRGAMYPWEAGPDGRETTPRFAFQNALYENHVNGDVALAAWQYFLATGDHDWLARYGMPIIAETADFWTSRVSFNKEKARYEIGRVVSVNESLIGVNNDPYTNAAAKKNFDIAIAAARLLGRKIDPKWEEVSRHLYIPTKESILIDYPLELGVSRTERRAIAQAALAAPPRGAMMGTEFYPILGVELGDREFIDALLPRTWRPYVRPPFNVLPETPDNDNTNFITGAGAFLQQFLFGYPGLRLGETGLAEEFKPLLPKEWRFLELRHVTVRGHSCTLRIAAGNPAIRRDCAPKP